MIRFLVDTSALTRAARPTVRRRLDEIAGRGGLVVCGPVEYEMRFGAPSSVEYRAVVDQFERLASVAVRPGTVARALHIQALLTERGHHRALSFVDLLCAALADENDLVVLHYDADYDLVHDVTRQPTEWIVERGSVP